MSVVCFQLSLASRQMLLLETLMVKQSLLDPVPAALKLPVAVSCYWVQHAEATLKLHHLQALLLGMLLGPLCAMVSSPGRYLHVPGVCLHELCAYNQQLKQTKVPRLFIPISCIRT